MPKLKSNSSAAKRFRKTSGGYKCKHSHLRHLLTKKSTARKRNLRSPDSIDKFDVPVVRKMLPYS